MQELREDTRFAINVDGAEVQVDAGLTILSALKTEGIDIPSLCHDIRLERSERQLRPVRRRGRRGTPRGQGVPHPGHARAW